MSLLSWACRKAPASAPAARRIDQSEQRVQGRGSSQCGAFCIGVAEVQHARRAEDRAAGGRSSSQSAAAGSKFDEEVMIDVAYYCRGGYTRALG